MTQVDQTCLHASAIKDRARIYLAVFRELSDRYGADEATGVMRSASRAHGLEVGASLAHLAPRDFAGMLDAYFRGPDGGATYSPRVNSLGDAGLDVQMMTCPLKDGWLELGCSDAEVCALLRCATAFDEAVYTQAGFEFELIPWSPGKEGCCRTRLWAKAQD